MAAVEREELLAVEVRPHRHHARDVDQGRAVHAREMPRIEPVLELAHGGAQHVGLAVGVDAHVVAGGIDPADAVQVHAHGAAAEGEARTFQRLTGEPFGEGRRPRDVESAVGRSEGLDVPDPAGPGAAGSLIPCTAEHGRAGTTEEQVIRVLSSLKKESLIYTSGKRIGLTQLDLLKKEIKEHKNLI